MRTKKWIVLICCAILLTSTHIYADSLNDLIGKTVENVRPLYINGARSEQDVLIIEDRSYIPVRSALTMFGYDVDYEDGKVLLEKVAAPEDSTPEAEQPEKKPSTPVFYYGMITDEMIDNEIDVLKHQEGIYNDIIEALMPSHSYTSNHNYEMLNEYYMKLSNVTMQIQYWEMLKQLRAERPDL